MTRQPQHPSLAPIARRTAAFTLLELIISIALVLVLMLAITKIFSITSSTIGASQGFAAATRDARAAQAVFAHDIGSMASNTPWIWIRYDAPKPAFRNAVDEKGDKDYIASGTSTSNGLDSAAQNRAILTVDTNGNGIEGEGATVPGEEVTSTVPGAPSMFRVSNRNHRQDRFSFCARDRFYRETGNSVQNTLVANMSSAEAWITYGHLVLPFTDGTFKLNGNTGFSKTNPGDGSAQNNPQNFYASQWVLGRAAMLMVLPTGAPSGNPGNEYINDSYGIAQEYYGRAQSASGSWTSAGNYGNMTPLSDGTSSTYPSSGRPLNNARYDLVGIDIANAINRIKLHTNAAPLASATEIVAGPPVSKSASVGPWYTNMLSSRFQVNPFTIKPISAGAASQQVPLFLPACSQFIVEFAGDFVSQTSAGAIDDTGGAATKFGLQPDGQIDFHYDSTTQTRQIQWYGYPRSPANNATISAANSGDVVLLSDFVKYINTAPPSPGAAGGYINNDGTARTVPAPSKTYMQFQDLAAVNANFASFEHYSAGSTGRLGYDNDTNNRALKFFYGINDPTSSLGSTGYYCAWGPDSIQNPSNPRPKMIRITVTIDRPELAGRTNDGQTFQYVFNLNQ